RAAILVRVGSPLRPALPGADPGVGRGQELIHAWSAVVAGRHGEVRAVGAGCRSGGGGAGGRLAPSPATGGRWLVRHRPRLPGGYALSLMARRIAARARPGVAPPYGRRAQ